MPNAAHTRKLNTLRRARRVQQLYHQYHEVDRLRLDDTIQRIADELFVSTETVWKDLKRDVGELEA